MKFRLAFLLLITLLFSSCTTLKILKIVNHPSVHNTAYYHIIPFESKDNMILVKVRIKGIEYDFIFDTGAFTVLSDQLTDAIKLKRIKGPGIMDSQGNKQSIDFVIPDSLSLGDMHFIKPGCGIYNFRDNLELSCFSFQGILGANVLTNTICQINFRDKTLILTDNIQKLYLPENLIVIPFRKHITGQPVVRMKVDGITIRNVILDYGSGGGFNLSAPRLIKSIEKKSLPHATYTGYHSVGLFGKKEDEIFYYKPAALKIESLDLKDETLVLSRNKISTIGVKFLQNYIVTIDFKESKVYLEPLWQEKDNQLSTYGLTPVMAEGKLIVSGLFKPSPAAEAGIKKGDQILRVDQRDFSFMDPDTYCEILKNGIFEEGKDTAVVEIKSDTLIRSVRLVRAVLLE
ncbi:MAG: aspartyl protease family protein [Bacteroidales bacterium]